ncbi:oxidoreductase [Cobetia marina]
MIDQPTASALFTPFTLPCGRVLANRLIKAAMSDSLGDGTGHPSDAQMRLYERWAEGGVAASLVGEVQPDHHHAEKPGNLVLNAQSDLAAFTQLAQRGQQHGADLWLQLGHAGAMAYPPTSTPHGPSALDTPGLRCEVMSLEAIKALPAAMATTARLACDAGFGGVQVHAAHGFLLSQFLSPLFNQRTDDYGGSLDNRMRLMREVIIAVREAVGHDYPVMVKLNSSDQLEGGFEEAEALQVIAALDELPIDLIDISGGTYFPGASSASDASASGPLRRVRQARTRGDDPAADGDRRLQDSGAGRRRRGTGRRRFRRPGPPTGAAPVTAHAMASGRMPRARVPAFQRAAGRWGDRLVDPAPDPAGRGP